MGNQILPTIKNNRIEILDVIRGVAVFGILLSNILIISGFYFTPFTELEKLHLSSLNNGIFIFSLHAIIGKSYPMFSMLFGIGFYMQYLKYKEAKQPFVRFYLWRMLLLFLIGLIHAVIWPGDVVHFYALLGLFFIPIRKLEANKILIISIILFAISLTISLNDYVKELNNNAIHPERTAIFQLPGVEFEELKNQMQNEGIRGMWFFNKQEYKIVYAFSRLKTATINVIALFLLGAFLYAKGFITSKMYKWKYLIIFAILGAIGKYLVSITFLVRIIEHVFMSLFFITLMGMIYKSKFGSSMLSFFGPVGRMALTNYILQSVIAIFIFYGIGLGYFSEIPLYGIFLICFGILTLQAIFSNLWLRRYHFGPIEWLWRTLTYNKNLSLKIKKQ